MTERTPQTDPQQVWIGDMPFVVKGQVNMDFVNIFSRKVNQGDPGPDDHPIYSTWTQRDWTGGGQVARSNPASDQGRYWFSTCETQYADTIALPPYTYSFAAPGGETDTPVVLGDLGNTLYVAWGTHVYTFNPGSFTWTGVTPWMGTAALREGTRYVEQTGANKGRSVLFIPQGSTYQVYVGGSYVSAPTGTWGAIEFATWDQKIFMLTSDGAVYWADHVPTTAADWTLVSQLADGSTPRHLIQYQNKLNERNLFVITDQYVYAVDYAGSIFHQSDLEYPRHPHMARAAAKWQGDLYTSVAIGAFRDNGSTILPMGLDRDHGLPEEFQGFIVDFAESYNGLFALLQGAATDTEAYSAPDPYLLQLGGGDDQINVRQTNNNNLLMVWNGYGWHYRWNAAGSPPTNVLVSQAQSFYSVWWGAGGTLYMQRLPRIYFNVRNAAAQFMGFAESCYHESPWYNWGWLGSDKILKIIELSLQQTSITENVDVQYKLDYDFNEWKTLGTLSVNGKSRYRVGIDPAEPVLRGGIEKALGEDHDRLKLRFVLRRDPTNPYVTPILEWHTAESRKWLRPIRTWSFVVDVTQPHRDHTPEEMRQHLVAVGAAEHGTVLQVGEDIVIADLTNLGVQRTPGDRSQAGYIKVTLIESFD